MNRTNSVSILGCGWLGFPLAEQLIKLGYRVKGSTTRHEQFPQFREAAIQPYLLRFDQPDTLHNFQDFIDSDVLIIAVPPGNTPEKQDSYLQFFRSLEERLALADQIRQVMYVSSTSVYGEPNKVVDEAFMPEHPASTGNLLLAVEESVRILPVPSCIIRAGGLIGPGRHPGRFFAGRQQVPNGLAPVNLIHLQDVMGIMIQAMTQGYEGILNACAPTHPSRSDFYNLAAEQAGLARPEFIPEIVDWKQVESVHLQQIGYTFSYPDLLNSQLFQSL